MTGIMVGKGSSIGSYFYSSTGNIIGARTSLSFSLFDLLLLVFELIFRKVIGSSVTVLVHNIVNY